MPRIGTREANFMPLADRQTRISLLWLPAFVPLWLAGCGAYGGGGNGGGGGGSAPSAPTGLTATAANAQVNLTWNASVGARSEEHTSELQSLTNLVCRLLLEKKKQNTMTRAK